MNIKFAENLKRLRLEHNLTQKQLAEDLKLARSTISMYEKGEREPSFETAELIADYFNVPLNMLISNKEIRDYFFEFRKKQLKLAFFKDATVPDELLDRAQSFAWFVYDNWKAKQKEEKDKKDDKK